MKRRRPVTECQAEHIFSAVQLKSMAVIGSEYLAALDAYLSNFATPDTKEKRTP